MIAYLKGKILSKSETAVVLENQGIGYKVFLPAAILLNLRVGDIAIFHIHTHVREDQLTLYGFLSAKELDLFESLLSVSGVGPKVALAILSGADPDTIISAIASGDSAVFTKVSGVGKKTGERIVMELKEKIGDSMGSTIGSSHYIAESLDALLALGYSKQEAREALNRVSKDIKESSGIVKEALKVLGKR